MKVIAFHSLRALGVRFSRNVFPYLLALSVPTASFAWEAHGSDVFRGRGANPRARRAPAEYGDPEPQPPARQEETGGTVIPEAPPTRRRQAVDYSRDGAEDTGGTLISVPDIKNIVQKNFTGGLDSIGSVQKLRELLASSGFRLSADAEEWFDSVEKKVLNLTPPANVAQDEPLERADPRLKNQTREKEKTPKEEDADPEPDRTEKPLPEKDSRRELVRDEKPKETTPSPEDPKPGAPDDKPVADGTAPRGTPAVDPVTGRPVVAGTPADPRVEPTSGKGNPDPVEDYLQRLKKKKDQDSSIVRRITEIESTTTFDPEGEELDEEEAAVFADGHGTDAAELEDFPPPPRAEPRVSLDEPSRKPLKEADPAGLDEKRAAAIREAEEALSDASLSADELQSKLNRLISLASSEELADGGDGEDVRVVTVPPPPVTVVNNFTLPAQPGAGGKALDSKLAEGFPDEKDLPEGETKESKRPNAAGEYAEAIPQPGGGKRKRAMVLLPPKRRGAVAAAAGSPTATVKTAGGPQGSKISKSLIQGLKDAIAARRGLTRTHASVLAAVPAMARKMGEGAVSATRKLARLYAGSLIPEGPAAPLGAGVTTALSLLLLGGLFWAARRRGDERR